MARNTGLARIFAIALFCALAAGNAFGTPLVWTTSAVTFADGGHLYGSFVYDPDTSTAISWNLYTSAGTNLPTAQAYNATNGSVSATSATITFTATATGRTLKLSFNSFPTDSGGTVVLSGATQETSGSSSRTATAGSVNAATPQTITLDSIPNQILGTPPLPLSAKGSGGSLAPVTLPVTFHSTTPSACSTAQAQIQLLGPGVCILQAATASQSFTVSQANVAGTLAASTGSPFATGSGPDGIAIGDFNGDSKPDLAVVNSLSNTVSILIGDGSGNFSLGSNSATGSNPEAVAVGDFDGDGQLDLAVADTGDGTVTILIGDGNGNFTATPGSPINVGGSPFRIAAGDFNGDGILDLATDSSTSTGGVTILLGNGSGGFTKDPLGPYGAGANLNPLNLVVADMNNDGISDLVIANNGGGSGSSVSVLLGTGALNSGSGLFTPAIGSPYSLPTVSGYGVAVGDFNHDGLQDFAIVSATSPAAVIVMLAQAGGGYAAAPNGPFSFTGVDPEYLVTGDFNGDGIPDLAVANQLTNNTAILLGDGKGNFAEANGSPFSNAGGAGSVVPVVGDFNLDGIDDVAVTNTASNNVTVLLGSAAGTVSTISTTSPSTISSGANVPLTLTVADTRPAYQTLTGIATFFDNGSSIGVAAQTTSPYAFTVNSPAAGTHVYTAQYGGGSGSAASSTNAVTIDVLTTGSTAQTITFDKPPDVTIGVTPFSIASYASATSGLSVHFASNTLAVCSVSGWNDATVTVIATGTCSITASQPGNATFAPATPVTQTFSVLAVASSCVNTLGVLAKAGTPSVPGNLELYWGNTWTANNPVDHYDIYRSLDANFSDGAILAGGESDLPAVQAPAASGGLLEFTDTGVSSGKTYYYWVASANAAGAEICVSGGVQGTLPAAVRR